MFNWMKRFWAGTSSISAPARWLIDWVRGDSGADSGAMVNQKTVIGYAPVWYAVSRIAGHISTLPITPMRILDRGSEKDTSHPCYRLLRTRPNPFQSASQFKETMMVHALLEGNGKAAIIRGPGGRPQELILIQPHKSVTCFVNGVKLHAVQINHSEYDEDRADMVLDGKGIEPEGKFGTGSWVVLLDSDVLHIPGLGVNGTVGLRIYDVSKNTFGLGLAAEQAASADFKNGSKPGVILQVPANFPHLRDERDAKSFIDNFNKFHMGLGNRGRAALLRDGITATTMETSNDAAQWVEQRTFQRQDVALLFGLESILGDDDSVSYGSAEQKDIAYLKNTLAKWLVKWEQECDEKLLSQRQKDAGSHEFKFNTAALLRTDFKTTIDALGVAITHRIMSPNEAREKIDMNPYDGGDEYLNPAITPGAGQDEPDDDDEDEQDTVTPEDANKAALIAHLSHLVEVEMKQVLGAAGNKRNYVGWVEQFYNKWEKTLGRAVHTVGGPVELARIHCNESRDQLASLGGMVPAAGLADAVEETIKDWPIRAELLAAQILGEVRCLT